MADDRDEQFRVFVQVRRPELVRTAVLLTAGDTYLAEDIVQTTLTRLYVAWAAFCRADNSRSYARRALINALLDERRRPWRRRELGSSSLPDRAHSVSDRSASHPLHAALAGLAPRMRAVVVLRYFDELTVAETASALGCSEGTVKSQTARAFDLLRRRLGTAVTGWPDPYADGTPRPTPTTRSATSPLRSADPAPHTRRSTDRRAIPRPGHLPAEHHHAEHHPAEHHPAEHHPAEHAPDTVRILR